MESTIRVHYRPEGKAGNRGEVELRLVATGLSLSGEYIDRAETTAKTPPADDQWRVLDLDVEAAWKRKHTRVDLIEFLEVAVEAVADPDAVFNCLIDGVEVDLRKPPITDNGRPPI